MTTYDELLKVAKKKAELFRLTAVQFIPKMYDALRNENPNTTPQDARARIEKDCIGIWSKRTLLDALPDEAKNQEKQTSGRLGQKKRYLAADSAAPVREKILIDANGKSIEDRSSFEEAFAKDFSLMKLQPEEVGATSKAVPSPKECPNCQESNLKINELEEALSMRAISKANERLTIVRFEFSLLLEHIRRYVEATATETDDKVWFTGTIDKQTGKVISLYLNNTASNYS